LKLGLPAKSALVAHNRQPNTHHTRCNLFKVSVPLSYMLQTVNVQIVFIDNYQLLLKNLTI